MNTKLRLVLILIIFTICGLNADISVNLDKYDISRIDSVEEFRPGKPAISFLPLKVLIPMGEKVTDIEIELSNHTDEFNYSLRHVNSIVPTDGRNYSSTSADEAVYSSNRFYPYTDFQNGGSHLLNGYKILLLNVYNEKYNPVEKTLRTFNQVNVTVYTESDRNVYSDENSMLLETAEKREQIKSMVVNPDQVSTYCKTNIERPPVLLDPLDPHAMIIITDVQRASWFDGFVQWKASKGINADVFTTESILAAYNGVDDQEKIREFIKDAYTTYSASTDPLRYVILGGDDEIIPVRYAWAAIDSTFSPEHVYDLVEDVPTDFYYSALDGSWNDDNDNDFGEPGDNPDMFPEVALGRIPCETQEEFNHFFNKLYHYVDVNTDGNDFVYLIGEDLDWTPQTWGGDSMDELAEMMPEEYHYVRLYEREGTYSQEAVVDALNFGPAIIFHDGHANSDYVLGIPSGAIANLENTQYGLIYTHGCHSAGFDELESGPEEAISEKLIFNEGGLFAYFGNTRYGWGELGTTNGGSQWYHRAFVDAIFADGIHELGWALQQSRIDLANQAVNIEVWRWIHYELVMFGDPSAELKMPQGIFPELIPENVQVVEETGDFDGIFNPGETVNIEFTLASSIERADADSVRVSVEFPDSVAEVLSEDVYIGGITAGSGADITGNSISVRILEETDIYDIDYKIVVDAAIVGGEYHKEYDQEFELSMMQSDWPKTLNYFCYNDPVILKVNNRRKIINISSGGEIIISGVYGNEESVIDLGEITYKNASFADLNNDGVTDVVVGVDDSLFAYSLNGQRLWAKGLSHDFNGTEYEAFLDSDPVIAHVTSTTEYNVVFSNIFGDLYCLDANGNEVISFPDFGNGRGKLTVSGFDNDGLNEIVYYINDVIHVFNNTGAELNSFPASQTNADAEMTVNNVYVYFYDGNGIKRVSMDGNVNNVIDLPECFIKEIAFGEMDNVSGDELVFTLENGDVYISDTAGQLLNGFPVSLGEDCSVAPLLADVNDDDRVDVIQISEAGNVYIIQSDGTLLNSAPFQIGLDNITSGTITDIDYDGDFELLFNVESAIAAIDFKYALGSKSPWIHSRGNLRRTGNFDDNELVPVNEDVNKYSKTEIANYPNPFNPETTISLSLKDEKLNSVKIYNIKGQLVTTLWDEQTDASEMKVIWKGVDSKDKAVGSGVYFYKVQTDKNVYTEKMLLLK